MPKYLIEREIPGVGSMSAEQFQSASQKSCDVLRKLGPEIQWVHSYATADKLYCVYIASGEDLIQEHARQTGFACRQIMEIDAIIDPTTAEPKAATV